MRVMKLSRKLCAILLAATAAASATACGPQKEEVNDAVTNVYVQIYDGGYGYGWLENIAADFESEYKDYQNPVNGKTGVKIIVDPVSETGENVFASITAQDHDIVFTEQVDNYMDFVESGYLLDITDILTENIAGQDHSIAAAMDEYLRDYYKVNDKYYGLSYGSGFYSLFYDEGLFYNEGFLLKREADANDPDEIVALTDSDFIARVADTERVGKAYAAIVTDGDKSYYKTVSGDYLSMGPDGQYGTYDDGLPRTYNEFFALVKYMSEASVVPFDYIGVDGGGCYVPCFLAQLCADYEGYDQTLVNYTFDGIKDNLIRVTDGTIEKLPSVTLVPDNSNGNAAETYKSAGKYYALDFYSKMMTGRGRYVGRNLKNKRTQFDAQSDFIKSKYSTINKTAFLLDGTWWMNESSVTFNSLSKNDDRYKPENRDFKMLALPKADKTKTGAGEKVTYLDVNYLTAMVLKKTSADKVELAKKFLQYCFTDKANKKFTVETQIPRPYSYDLGDDYSRLTPYGQNLWDVLKNQSRTVYPVSQSEHFKLKGVYYNSKQMFTTRIAKTNYTGLDVLFRTGKSVYTAETVYNGLYDYFLTVLGG